MLRAPRKTVERARKLRRQMSLPEILLWRELKKRPGGFKFRKQHPAGLLALDFFCAEAKLCIGVDGEAHNRGDQPAFDAGRSAWLRLHDIETLRIPATVILKNSKALSSTSSKPSARGYPSTIRRKRRMVPLPVPGRNKETK